MDKVVLGIFGLIMLCLVVFVAYLFAGAIALSNTAPTETGYFCGEDNGVLFTHKEVNWLYDSDFYDNDFHFMDNVEYAFYCKGEK